MKLMYTDARLHSNYNFFLFSLKNEVRKSVYRKRRQLKLAFDLICEKLENKMVLKFERWKDLLQVLCPNYSLGKVSLLWHVLDRKNRDYISKQYSFFHFILKDLLQILIFRSLHKKFLYKIKSLFHHFYRS